MSCCRAIPNDRRRGNIFLFLQIAAVPGDGECGPEVLHIELYPPGSGYPGNLLRHQDGFEEAHAIAAQLLRQHTGKEAQFAHARNTISAKLMFAFFFSKRGCYIFFSKTLGSFLHQALLFS
jgi:hypothetical protein